MDYDSLTDDQIRQKLVEAGVSVGPIVASTRPVYIKKLRRLAGEEPASPERHPEPVRVEEDDELSEVEPPRRASPLRAERPMSARPRQPLHDQTSGDELRHRRPSPRKKLDVKIEKQMESSSGGGIIGFIAKAIGFLALFALFYFLLTLYMTDGKPTNLITESG